MERTVIRIGVVAVILAWLSGFASPEELRAADEAACASYGFQPNTPDFSACIQRESLMRRYAPPPPGWYGPGWYDGRG